MTARLRIVVLGRGKVGSSLARAWRRSGAKVVSLPGRTRRLPPADLVVLAVPDGALPATAARLALALDRTRVGAVVHCAGAFGPEVLEPLSEAGIATAQMHLLVSFAARSVEPPEGAAVLIQGERGAVAIARRAVRRLRLVPIAGPVEPAHYHAAAALVSNGAVGLVAAAARLLEAAGVSADDAGRMLGRLLASTAHNVATLGVPAALTGPVRRGDVHTVALHLAALAEATPDLLPLHRELAQQQLVVVRRLPKAEQPDSATLRRMVAALAERPSAARSPSRTRRRG